MSLRDLFCRPAYGNLPLDSRLDPVDLPLSAGVLTGLRAFAEVFSDGPRRGAVLMLPGYTGSKEDFREVLPRISALGWDVLALSRRGQGDSPGTVEPSDYSLDTEARDVVEVLQMLRVEKDPFHLLGHSLGGVIARAATITSPADIGSLTMMCSGPHGWAHRKLRESTLAAKEGMQVLWEASNPRWIGRGPEQMDPDTRFVYQRMIDTGPGSIIGGATILESPEDTTDQLRRIGTPVHVVRGQTDEHWPSEWQQHMAQKLDARYSVIPHADHSPQLENPAETARTLSDFWAATQPRATHPE